MNKKSIKTGLFYLAATLIIPLLVILCIELSLKIGGYGYKTDFYKTVTTPEGNFHIDNQDYSRTWFPPRLARPVVPFRLPVTKTSSQFRIFIFGASAARGVPQPMFGFSRILEKQLEHSFPGIDFLIVNTSMTAVNSHVVRDIAKECSRLQPDLFIIFLGNNEIVGPFGPGTVFSPFMSSRFLINSGVFLRKTRTGQLIRQIINSLKISDKRNMNWGGMSMFIKNSVPANDPRLKKAYRNFENNIVDICNIAVKKDVPVILSTVPVNIRDCPPFASVHDRKLKQSDIYEFETMFERACRFKENGMFDSAVVLYEKALEKDTLHALTRFMLAECLENRGSFEAARGHFVSARNNDALRFRADTKINSIIEETAESGGNIILADTRKCFQQNSPHGTPGKNLFYEHVHLTFAGNYILAKNIYMNLSPVINEKFNKDDVTPACLSIDSCRHHLAYTEWNRFKALESIKRLLKEPPFKSQYGIQERLNDFKNEIIKIDTSLDKEGFSGLDADFSSALSLYPYDPFINFNYGTYCATVLHNHRKASIYLDRSLDIMPNFYNARINLAKVFSTEGKHHLAVRELEKVLNDIPGHSGALNQTAFEYAVLSNFTKADELLEKALFYSEKPTETYMNKAAVFEMRGMLDNSLKYLEKALEYQPESAHINQTIAHVLNKKGKHHGAAEYFRRAISSDGRVPENYYNLAHTLLRTNNTDEALSHLKTTISLDSTFLPAYILLVSISEMREKPLDALVYYRRIIELGPSLPQASFGKGLIALSDGDTSETVKMLETTLKLNPGYLPARSLLKKIK